MSKASPLQPSFSGGEFSPRVFGRVDSERYKTGLATCTNYLPTTQGPLVRRPGFKFVTTVKDTAKPPNLIEFKFSQNQNYVLEFGDKYIRFYANDGQVITSTTHFQVQGVWGLTGAGYSSSVIYGMRSSILPKSNEQILQSSVIATGSVLEIGSPYSYPDVFDLKVAQKFDTLYIVHSSYPEYKLQRFGNELWDLKKVLNEDGPYLDFNSYKSQGDSNRITLNAGPPTFISNDGLTLTYLTATTGPIRAVNNITQTGSTNSWSRIVSPGHNFVTGDKVVISGVVGSTGVNNSASSLSWTVQFANPNAFDLVDSVFGGSYVGSGLIYPAMFESMGTPNTWSDIGRTIGLIRQSDTARAWGTITSITDPAHFGFITDLNNSPGVVGTSSLVTISYWQMSIWNRVLGYPNAVCFHQDRKFLAGAPGAPQDFQASVVADYDNFQTSNSSLVVSDNSALEFGLNSDQLNAIFWMKSDTEGLLAGSAFSEWNVTPSTQTAALTPTNVSAKQTSYFGSANADAIQDGNATLYIQRAQRRLREMNYFFQVNTYRSTDLAELSEHITNPGIAKLSVQKETVPIVWARRTDGGLLSMVYNRDDTTLKVGWAKHVLGGQSDSGGTAPLVKATAVIPAPDNTFDQLWCVVQRFINNTSVCTVEYMTKPFDQLTNQADAFYADCGGTYDSPATISGISSGSAIVTAASHPFNVGDKIQITSVVGMNSSITNSDGIVFNSNLVNTRTFYVERPSLNQFYLVDLNSSYVNANSYSPYVSGGQARKYVSTISGLTWLKNEVVDVLADGGNHPSVQVNSAGVLALSYPATKVQVGYGYNSDGKTLRPEAGSRDGSSIGKLRNVGRVAFMLDNVGDFQIGDSFDKLTPLEFTQGDLAGNADTAPPLFSGIVRESLAGFDFDGQVCFRQSSLLPGMVQSVTTMLDVSDV